MAGMDDEKTMDERLLSLTLSIISRIIIIIISLTNITKHNRKSFLKNHHRQQNKSCAPKLRAEIVEKRVSACMSYCSLLLCYYHIEDIVDSD
jgi:hypothetical protein